MIILHFIYLDIGVMTGDSAMRIISHKALGVYTECILTPSFIKNLCFLCNICTKLCVLSNASYCTPVLQLNKLSCCCFTLSAMWLFYRCFELFQDTQICAHTWRNYQIAKELKCLAAKKDLPLPQCWVTVMVLIYISNCANLEVVDPQQKTFSLLSTFSVKTFIYWMGVTRLEKRVQQAGGEKEVKNQKKGSEKW